MSILFGFLLIAIPAIVAAEILERRRKSRSTVHSLPYTWGYFQGCYGLIMGLGALIASPIALVVEDAEPGAWLIWLALAALWLPAGYFVIKRRRWAWVVHTIASLNPLWWIINTIYARRRWAEFG